MWHHLGPISTFNDELVWHVETPSLPFLLTSSLITIIYSVVTQKKRQSDRGESILETKELLRNTKDFYLSLVVPF
jgi:hypothetical protein